VGDAPSESTDRVEPLALLHLLHELFALGEIDRRRVGHTHSRTILIGRLSCRRDARHTPRLVARYEL
jgi:hypothetical protein